MCVLPWVFFSARFAFHCPQYIIVNIIFYQGGLKMDWNIMFFVNSVLLGVGLAMDAFSVSLANGLKEPCMKGGRMCLISGTYAFFQFMMPMLGWICVQTVMKAFSIFEKFIPWIALILLLYIGGKMLMEGFSKKEEEENIGKTLSFGTFVVQGIATSIDALSVGFTISDYNFVMAFVCGIIIAIVTLFICMMGLMIGKKVGTKLSNKAAILGGVILIGIGIQIFVKGIFF